MREMEKHSELRAFLEIPVLAIGAGCERVLENAGFCIEFISSSSHGESFAREVRAHTLVGTAALLPRTKHCLKS